MINTFSQEYINLNQKKEKLSNLLLEGGISHQELYINEDQKGNLFLHLECICTSKTGYNTKFSKDLYNDKYLDKFIKNLEQAMKLSVIGKDRITMYPVISGGIQDFCYYINEERILESDLDYLFFTTHRKFRQEVSDKINEINKLLQQLSFLGLKYQGLIDNFERTKSNISTELEKNWLLQKSIKIDNMLKTVGMGLDIDITDLIKLIKGNDFKNSNYKDFMAIMDQVEKTTIAGHGPVHINIVNALYSDDIDDLIILNKLAEILKNKVIEIENFLNTNIELIQSQFQELKNLVNILNDTSAKDRARVFQSNKSIEELQIQETKKDEVKLENYRNYSYQNVQNEIWGTNKNADIFKRLERKQSELLTDDEIIALNLYKTQLYRAYNPIINFVRKNGLDESEIKVSEILDNFIKTAYNEMVATYKASQESPMAAFARAHQKRKSFDEMTIVDKIFSRYPDELPSYEQYKELIYKYINPLLSSLKKVTLDEDIIVFRGDNSQYELAGITSTTIDKQMANSFIDNRNPDHDQVGILYRIKIPKGAPVICFTDELIYGKNSSHSGFSDSQSEIIFDADLFDFQQKYSPIDFNIQGNFKKAAVYIDVEATLKSKENNKVF